MLLTTPILPLRCEKVSPSPPQFCQVLAIGISLSAATPICRASMEAPAPIEAAEVEAMSEKDLAKRIKLLEKQMLEHAKSLEFEKAARVRDQLALLREQAEKDLHAAMQQVLPEADAQFEAGSYTASLQTLAALRGPVDAFFDDVMVNAEEDDLRLNRQALLHVLHQAMNRVAELAQLAV